MTRLRTALRASPSCTLRYAPQRAVRGTDGRLSAVGLLLDLAAWAAVLRTHSRSPRCHRYAKPTSSTPKNTRMSANATHASDFAAAALRRRGVGRARVRRRPRGLQVRRGSRLALGDGSIRRPLGSRCRTPPPTGRRTPFPRRRSRTAARRRRTAGRTASTRCRSARSPHS